MRQSRDFDVVVMGGGSAGIVSGVTAGALGLKVLLIEKRRMGGECLNTGCVPSKALIQCAKLVHDRARARDFGLPPAPVSRAEAAGAMQYVRRSIDTVRDADATEQLLRDQGVEIHLGDARFLNPETIEFEGKRIRADQFILATGSRPRRPTIPGLDLARYLTNEEIFSIDAIPESLAVIGGGPIGVEMAQAFQRLGSRVTLIQRGPRILPRDDAGMARSLEGILRSDGVSLKLETEVVEAARNGGRRRLRLRGPDGEETLEVELILAAVGRQANVEGLDLPAAGIDFDERGVRVDDWLHTTGPRAWACGDVSGAHQFSHMAEYEAKLVVQNLFLPVRQRASFRTEAWATFTDPELASVGLTEEDAQRECIAYEVQLQPFQQDDRALIEGEGQGAVKILTTRWSGKILGAQILGPRAGELIQQFILAIGHDWSVREIADAVHIYPTLSVAAQRAAQRWYEKRAGEPAVQQLIRSWRILRAGEAGVSLAQIGAAVAAGGIAYGISRWRANRPK